MLINILSIGGCCWRRDDSGRILALFDMPNSTGYVINIDIFQNSIIDIDVFKQVHIDIDIFKNNHVDIDININIFQIVLIDIDTNIDIFKISLSIFLSISIFHQKGIKKGSNLLKNGFVYP